MYKMNNSSVDKLLSIRGNLTNTRYLSSELLIQSDISTQGDIAISYIIYTWRDNLEKVKIKKKNNW